MPGESISTTVTSTVTFGVGIYLGPLTVTATGDVAPSAYGAAGIYAPASFTAPRLLNEGNIAGAAGAVLGASPAGGDGVDFLAAGQVINGGMIGGGVGGYQGIGGTGVVLASGGSLANSGTIAGGVGYQAANFVYGGTGGVGVVLSGGGLLHNGGTIDGGAGGYAYTAGNGGTGVVMSSGGTLTNAGAIAGGAGGGGYGAGGAGAVGVYLGAGGTLINAGTIAGGSGGSAAGEYGSGGDGASGAHIGSAGILLNASSGTITGGDGGTAAYGTGAGGDAVELDDGSQLHNAGLILGGSGSDGLGAGVRGGAGVTVSNSGTIEGGAGRYSLFGGGGYAGAGVAGVILGANASVTNGAAGLIEGGAGFYNDQGPGGAGGSGVALGAGVLVNRGSIVGGAGGGSGAGLPGLGGVGVYLGGGTLINAGLIANGGGAQGGDAVLFGSSQAATLVVEGGAQFDGVVAASALATDTLVLSNAHGGGIIAGIGTDYTGFTQITEQAGANWGLGGDNTLGAATTFTIGGLVSVQDSLDGAGSAIVSARAILQNIGGGFLQLGGLQLAGGTLEGSAVSTILIGSEGIGGGPAAAGSITINGSANIEGFGQVNGAGVTDDGSIIARGGTLTLAGAVSGTGLARIDAGATLQLFGSMAASIVFGTGGGETLFAARGAAITGTIFGFGAGDIIDVRVAATALDYAAGVLTLLDDGRAVDQLAVSGRYTTAAFTLSTDSHGGADIGLLPGTHT
jgi:hypothetical protein